MLRCGAKIRRVFRAIVSHAHSGLSPLLAFDVRGFSRICFVFGDVAVFIRHLLLLQRLQRLQFIDALRITRDSFYLINIRIKHKSTEMFIEIASLK